jgi:shikimate 5-dehydrogenase
LTEYNAWFEADAFDGVAVPVQVEPSADSAGIVDAFRRLPMSGWHVHGVELQTGLGQALDEIGPKACRQGKVNGVVMLADGRLIGEWVESPREQYELWTSAG